MTDISILKRAFILLTQIVLISILYYLRSSSKPRAGASQLPVSTSRIINFQKKLSNWTCYKDPIRIVFLPDNWMKAPEKSYATHNNCDVPCMYTKDVRSSAINIADAVIIHTAQHRGHPKELLEQYKVNASSVLTVGMTMEAIPQRPHEFDHISEYDIEMSYRLSSDVVATPFNIKLLEKANPKWEQREKAVVFIAKNCRSRNQREELVKALQKYVRVDSVSDCLNNKQWPSDIPRTDKKSLLKRYVAVLAAENSIATDYVSEKVYDGLVTGTVPIYYGAPNVDQFVPSDSIIKVSYPFNNETIRVVADQVQRVLSHEQEYNKWIRYKQLGYNHKFKKMFKFTKASLLCRLCKKIKSLKC